MSALHKLKPCPFCGKRSHIEFWPIGNGAWTVSCGNDCDFIGPEGATKLLAARAWNQRPVNWLIRWLDRFPC